MNKNDIEIRAGLVRRENNSRTVCGYAVRFNEPSEDLGFIEIISPAAIDEATILNSDIFALLNHDESRVLARSNKGNGSLHLELRSDGLYYSFEAPNTVFGDLLLEYISRGEISASSFAFAIDPADSTAQRWYNENGKQYREINRIAMLFDCSPVFQPAYSTTSCAKRSLENLKLEAMQHEIENIYVGTDE